MKKILLADDSITIQKVISITFASEDYDLIIVGDGNSAIEKAKEVKPDLVLADVAMPGKNGYEVCEAVKNDPDLASIPVMLLAGTFEPLSDEEASRVRADDHIVKPFESEVLIQKVKDLLERPPQEVAQPGGTEPIEAEPIEAEPIEAEPIEPEPIGPGPVTAEVGAEPLEAKPPEPPEPPAPPAPPIWEAGDFLKSTEEAEKEVPEEEEKGEEPDFDFVEEAPEAEAPAETPPVEAEGPELGEAEGPEPEGVEPEVSGEEGPEPLAEEPAAPEVSWEAPAEEKPETTEPEPSLEIPLEIPEEAGREGATGVSAIPREKLEQIITKVIREVVEEIAWEVVPELAEQILRDEIISKIKDSMSRKN